MFTDLFTSVADAIVYLAKNGVAFAASIYVLEYLRTSDR